MSGESLTRLKKYFTGARFKKRQDRMTHARAHVTKDSMLYRKGQSVADLALDLVYDQTFSFK